MVKNLHANAGDSGLIPNWEDSDAAEQLSLWAITTDPGLQIPGSATTQPISQN